MQNVLKISCFAVNIALRLTMSNVIKLALKEETAEGNGTPKEIQKGLIRKERPQKAFPGAAGIRPFQRSASGDGQNPAPAAWRIVLGAPLFSGS